MIAINSKVEKAIEVAKSEVEAQDSGFMTLVSALEHIYDNPEAHPELPAWEKLAEQVEHHGSDDLAFWIDDHS